MNESTYDFKSYLTSGEYLVLDLFTNQLLETGYISSGLVVIFRSFEDKRLGIVHIVLPDSNVYTQKSKHLPGYFADTGIDTLLTKSGWNDLDNCPKDLEIRIIGAAKILASDQIFELGSKTLFSVKKRLEELGFNHYSQDVEGNKVRKIYINLNNGQVWVYLPDNKPYCF